jgi:hypothetical protein
VVPSDEMSRALLSLGLACSLSWSCSWMSVSSPPRSIPPPGQRVDCTESITSPVVDTVLAGLFGLSTLVLIGLVTKYDDAEDDNTTALIVGGGAYGGITLLFGLSAVSGYRDTRACRDLNARAVPTYPAPYPAPLPYSPLPPLPVPPPR